MSNEWWSIFIRLYFVGFTMSDECISIFSPSSSGFVCCLQHPRWMRCFCYVFHLSSLCILAALIGATDDKHPSGLVLLLSSSHFPSAPQVFVRVCDCREKAKRQRWCCWTSSRRKKIVSSTFLGGPKKRGGMLTDFSFVLYNFFHPPPLFFFFEKFQGL